MQKIFTGAMVLRGIRIFFKKIKNYFYIVPFTFLIVNPVSAAEQLPSCQMYPLKQLVLAPELRDTHMEATEAYQNYVMRFVLLHHVNVLLDLAASEGVYLQTLQEMLGFYPDITNLQRCNNVLKQLAVTNLRAPDFVSALLDYRYATR